MNERENLVSREKEKDFILLATSDQKCKYFQSVDILNSLLMFCELS